jgi:transcriptional regulator with XRE-family HTH domain
MLQSQSNKNHTDVVISDDERFWNVDFVIESIGYRPLARIASLSPGHVHKILNGKGKNVVLDKLKRLSHAAQIPFDDLLFYVERRRDFEQKIARGNQKAA